jgi:hypothetical protein
MPPTAPKDLDSRPQFVAADGYAAMFEDAPPPTAEDLRDLLPFEQFEPSADQPALERPAERRLRIAAA